MRPAAGAFDRIAGRSAVQRSLATSLVWIGGAAALGASGRLQQCGGRRAGAFAVERSRERQRQAPAAGSAVRLRRSGAGDKCGHYAHPPHQAPPDVHQQLQPGVGEVARHRPPTDVDLVATSDRVQRRRLHQPLHILDESGADEAGRRRAASSGQQPDAGAGARSGRAERFHEHDEHGRGGRARQRLGVASGGGRVHPTAGDRHVGTRLLPPVQERQGHLPEEHLAGGELEERAGTVSSSSRI
eukprot:ctg_3228.g473